MLVDFWTYSCINCQRSLPHVEGWYNDYKKDGLVVVGVSSPEFAFEHVVSNVESAASSLGIDYPVAVDDNLGHLGRLQQRVLAGGVPHRPHRGGPRLRLRRGRLRRHGEQHPDAADGERRHRSAAPDRRPDKTPTNDPSRPRATWATSDSTTRSARRSSTTRRPCTTRPRPSPRTASPSAAPGPCTPRRRPPGPTPRSGLQFTADDVYLVMSGTGTVGVSSTGKHLTTLDVGGIPKLYTLFSGSGAANRRAHADGVTGRRGIRLHVRVANTRACDARRLMPSPSTRRCRHHACSGRHADLASRSETRPSERLKDPFECRTEQMLNHQADESRTLSTCGRTGRRPCSVDGPLLAGPVGRPQLALEDLARGVARQTRRWCRPRSGTCSGPGWPGSGR